MISSIMFYIVETILDITIAIFVVSRFTKNSTHQYSKVIKTIFQYLKATRETKIIYRRERYGDLIIKIYSNSDWAGSHIIRMSRSGYIFILNSESVSSCSKYQAKVALSSIDVKYVALILVVKEAT